ncbi:CoA-binding protein [Sorangium sp. So ce1153]|uniref:CoA-binding protein n=1 Tax=Sorangium sp. So ce1153 TaxID=3133333 RepID=UPI003F5E7DE8
MRNKLEDVDEFLSHRRVALVGASHDDKDFSRMVMRELLDRGYDVVPVNPGGGLIEGRAACAEIGAIEPPVEAAIVMTPPQVTEQIVRACAAAGVQRVWLHRGVGQGAVSAPAVQACQELGIRVIAGECPLMFLPNAGIVHRLHRLAKQIAGSYPARA